MAEIRQLQEKDHVREEQIAQLKQAREADAQAAEQLNHSCRSLEEARKTAALEIQQLETKKREQDEAIAELRQANEAYTAEVQKLSQTRHDQSDTIAQLTQLREATVKKLKVFTIPV